MVEQQPTFVCQDRHITCTNLCTLPCTVFERSLFHYAAVFTPVLHIRAIADVDVTERSVTVVARTRKHSILTVNLFWEEHTITVERKECIFALEEFLEVECISDTDSWSVVTITPSNPVAVFNPSYAWVILIVTFNHVCVTTLEHDRFVVDFPVYTVFREACEDIHLHTLVVATEYTSEAITERNYSTVEDTV